MTFSFFAACQELVGPVALQQSPEHPDVMPQQGEQQQPIGLLDLQALRDVATPMKRMGLAFVSLDESDSEDLVMLSPKPVKLSAADRMKCASASTWISLCIELAEHPLQVTWPPRTQVRSDVV